MLLASQTCADLKAGWNIEPVAVSHGLAGHEAFTREGLAALAERLPQTSDHVWWRNSRVAVDGTWGGDEARPLSLVETIRTIDRTQSIVVLKRCDRDPVFGPILTELMENCVDALQPSARADVVRGKAIIFINSPGQITQYHMDGECVVVAGVVGEKAFRIWDQRDRAIVTQAEMEAYAAGDTNAARLKPGAAEQGRAFQVGPGTGVHIPVHAPHTAVTGDGWAASITLTFDLASEVRMKRLRQMNGRLRRLGLAPTERARPSLLDEAKIGAGMAAAALARTLRPSAYAPVLTDWSPKR